MKHILSLFVTVSSLVCILSRQANAQSADIKLSGKIIDAENGLPVVAASVTLEGLKKGVNTDVEGNFFLTVQQDRKYDIRVTSVGYAPKILSEVKPSDFYSAPLIISLDRSNSELAVVVVKASGRKQSVAGLYSLQKNSSSISDGISADIIRKSPDKNTGDVLRRVSGASVQDNKFVVIRGLSERYNVSMLNNSTLPSTEPDKKAFSFDIIPSSLVDNLVIYKSPTPDLPGDFAGGAVKISTKDYPSHKISELSVSLGFNTLTTFKDFYKSYPDGSLDFLGFLDNSRLIPGPYYRHRGAGFINNSAGFKNAVTKMFPNTFGYKQANKTLPDISVSYSNGNTKLFDKSRKLGYIYSVSYGSGRKVSERLRDEYQIDKLQQYEYSTQNYEENKSLSALLNLTYSFGKSKLSLKNLFNNDFSTIADVRQGYDVGSQPDIFYYKSANSEVLNNGLINSVLEGVHKVSDSWTIDWNASMGYTYRNQPDQRVLTFRTPLNQKSGYYLKLSNENSPQIRDAGRIYSFLGETIYGANLNGTKHFEWKGEAQKFKFGLANYYRNRDVEVDALGYASQNHYGETIYETKGTSFNSVFSPENIDRYNLTVANIGTNSTDYHGTSLLNAGYAMLDNKFSDKIKLTWGIRTERYMQKLTAKGQEGITADDIDFLPSVLFTYGLNNKMNIRVAGSQSVNRPEFRELASYSVYDYDNYFVIKGNPALRRSKNTNADLRFELFPAAGEIVSASVFYKYFDQPIEQVNQGNDVLTYSNADHAIVYGTEIELRKKLDFFNSSLLDHLTIYSNLAYIKGSVKFGNVNSNSPLQGQSPYLINGGLTYTTADNMFYINLLYNRIGQRLKFRAVGEGALNIFEKPRDVLDLQVSKKFDKGRLEAKLTINDIFAQAYSWYYKFDPNSSNTNYKASEDKIITAFKYGTTTLLSFKYNIAR